MRCKALQDTYGKPCPCSAQPKSKYCGRHSHWDLRRQVQKAQGVKTLCTATVRLGHRCTKHAAHGTSLCSQHQKQHDEEGSKNKLSSDTSSPAPKDGPAQNTRSKTQLTDMEKKHLGSAFEERCKNAKADTLRSLMNTIYYRPSLSDSVAKQGWIYMYKLEEGNEISKKEDVISKEEDENSKEEDENSKKKNEYKIGSHHGQRGEDRVKEWEKQCGYKAEVIKTWPVLFASSAETLIATELKGLGFWTGSLKYGKHRGLTRSDLDKNLDTIDFWVKYVNDNKWLMPNAGDESLETLKTYPQTLLPAD